MPTFPSYESNRQLTTQQPSFLAPSSTEGQVIEKVGQAASAVPEAALKWSNAVDTIQTTTSQANFKSGVLDILQRAENDPDYNSSAKYLQEVEKLRADSLKGFSSKGAERNAALELGYQAKVASIQLQNTFKKKIIDVGQTSALKMIDTEINNPTDGSLPNIKKLLDQQVQAGIFDQKDAYQLYQRANKDLGVNRINKDLYLAQTPEQVDAITQGITSGAYEKGGVTIDPDKKKALLDIADRARTNTEKKIQAQQVEAQAQNRVDTIAGVASGQINLENLNIADIAEYDPQLGATLTKAKEFMTNYNPKTPPEEQRVSMAGVLSASQIMQARDYAKSVREVFMQNENEKLGKFVLRELEKKGDGKTPSVKLAAFMQLAALKAKANNPQTPEGADSANRLRSIKAAVKFLEASNPYLAPSSIGEFITRNFLSGAKDEKAVMQEAKSVLKDQIIDRYKAVSKLPSIPNKIVDGEASVEDLQSGMNDYSDGESSGDYADASSD